MTSVDPRRDRITVPVDVDRAPATTVAVAAGIARQGGLGLEFVASGASRVDPMHRLRRHVALAGASGVDDPTWALLDGHDADVGAYATWSGTLAVCLGTGTHRPPALPRCGVPLLVVGPRAVVPPASVRRVIAGLDGSAVGLHVAIVAGRIAERLGADLELTEVVDVVDRRWLPADVHESAYVQRIAELLDHRPRTFEILHDDRPAAGLLRFVGRDRTAVIAVGMSAHRHLRGVVQRVIRCSPCPVLLVPRVSS